MSAESLAAYLGVNVRQVQRWETGEQAGWTADDLHWIAARTGCPLSFLAGTEWADPDPTFVRPPRPRLPPRGRSR